MKKIRWLFNLTAIFVVWIIFQNLIITSSSNYFKIEDTYLGGGKQAYESSELIYARGNFDGIHYIGISGTGYGYAQQAFFPLYPLLIRAVSGLNVDKYLTGVLISNFFFFCSIIILFKLLIKKYSENQAYWVILVLLVFPTSFFFTSIYTESTFLFFLISSIFFWQNKNWKLAGIFGFLASFTRMSGVFLLPAYFFSWFWGEKKSYKVFYTFLLIPLGLFSYMIYLLSTTGDPLMFLHVQALFGQNRSDNLVMLPQVIWRYIKIIISIPRTSTQYLSTILEFSTGIFFLITSIISFKKISREISIFSAISYLVPTLTGTFASLPRYVLTCLGTFILVGTIIASSKRSIKIIYLLMSISLLFLFSAMFYSGNWVS